MIDRTSSDEALLRRWREARRPEERRMLLERLLTPHLPRVSRWAHRMCRDAEEARDVAQEALLAVCEHLGAFRGECRFSTWLYTIVRNHARKRAAAPPGRRELPLDDLGARTEWSFDPREHHDVTGRLQEATQLLSTLSGIEARVFLLHYGGGVPLLVLNRELELTNRSGARAYLVSAKRKLRRTLDRRRRARAVMPRAVGDGRGPTRPRGHGDE